MMSDRSKRYTRVRPGRNPDFVPKPKSGPVLSLAERLLERRKITDRGCWIWTGKTACGYGEIAVNGKTMGVHRAAYEVFIGPIPAGLQIMHSCDRPTCFNPDHLSAGTAKENAHDMFRKGRDGRHGSAAPWAKLTEELVLKIRSDPRPATAIAKEVGTSAAAICDARVGRSWRHVAFPPTIQDDQPAAQDIEK